MFGVGLGTICEQIPREERKTKISLLSSRCGKETTEDTGSPVKFSVCVANC